MTIYPYTHFMATPAGAFNPWDLRPTYGSLREPTPPGTYPTRNLPFTVGSPTDLAGTQLHSGLEVDRL